MKTTAFWDIAPCRLEEVMYYHRTLSSSVNTYIPNRIPIFNTLKPSGNYIHHFSYQSVTLYFVFMGYVWFLLLSKIKVKEPRYTQWRRLEGEEV
jgi:hypothetical protein